MKSTNKKKVYKKKNPSVKRTTRKLKSRNTTKETGDLGENLVAGIALRNGFEASFTKASGMVRGVGDLAIGGFSVEVKTGKSVSMTYDKWEKTILQAQRASGFPMMSLVLKKDGFEPVVLAVVTMEQLLSLLK